MTFLIALGVFALAVEAVIYLLTRRPLPPDHGSVSRAWLDNYRATRTDQR